MSCGCGGRGALPVSVSLRMEAVRLALQSGSEGEYKARAEWIFGFVTDGHDLAELDVPPAPVATGTSQDAVTSRNALLFQPVRQIHGLSGVGNIAALCRELQARTLGELVQASLKPIGKGWLDWNRTVKETLAALRAYGLTLEMTTDDLRNWVLGAK